MATTADIKNGLCIVWNHDIFQFVEFQHVKPGKGNAFVRCKMKSFKTGRLLEHTFPSGHDIETARVVRQPHQFLYSDDTGYHFMNQETYDQIFVNGDMIENKDLMKEGDICDIVVHEETNQILSTELPNFVVLEVVEADPNVKGNSSSNVTKNCKVETGATIKVPMFVEAGTKIKIDTRTREYMDRV
ncbi:MAG: elongation factor P [Chitinophagales bacterium]|jgi:elongation factor P|nr:elongation factor P [Chitinophagales bacterium]